MNLKFRLLRVKLIFYTMFVFYFSKVKEMWEFYVNKATNSELETKCTQVEDYFQ